MREVAQWLSEAVSAVETCGDPEADLLLQQGITSLEDLAECQSELLTQLPGIDEDGARRIKERAVELAERKRQEEEQARIEAEAAEQEAAAARAAEALAAEAQAAEEETELAASGEASAAPADAPVASTQAPGTAGES